MSSVRFVLPRSGFNEAAARKRRILHYRPAAQAWHPRFNEAAARKRRILGGSCRMKKHDTRFNEAAARKRRIRRQRNE